MKERERKEIRRWRRERNEIRRWRREREGER